MNRRKKTIILGAFALLLFLGGYMARTMKAAPILGLHASVPVLRGYRVLPYMPESHQWKNIVIHHSATDRGNAKIFDKGHRLRGFEEGLGYHFVVGNGTYGTGLGKIEVGHRWYRQLRGAHCKAMDMNEKAIGICLVGNFNDYGVPSEELVSAVWLVKHLQKRYGISREQIMRHKDAKKNGTDCPGNQFPWEAFMQMLN